MSNKPPRETAEHAFHEGAALMPPSDQDIRLPVESRLVEGFGTTALAGSYGEGDPGHCPPIRASEIFDAVLKRSRVGDLFSGVGSQVHVDAAGYNGCVRVLVEIDGVLDIAGPYGAAWVPGRHSPFQGGKACR